MRPHRRTLADQTFELGLDLSPCLSNSKDLDSSLFPKTQDLSLGKKGQSQALIAKFCKFKIFRNF